MTEQLLTITTSEAPGALTINMDTARYTALMADSRKNMVEYIKGCVASLPGKGIEITMPCGAQKVYASADDLPQHSEPCTCGNPDHWFVRYLNESEGEND